MAQGEDGELEDTLGYITRSWSQRDHKENNSKCLSLIMLAIDNSVCHCPSTSNIRLVALK